MIILKNLKWKNLLSFGNSWTEIQLDRSPSTLVLGKSGSGKSTIIEAITFSLFGKPFRKIQKKTLCNSINQKDCVVEIEFLVNEVPHKVVRGIKPDIFQIFCDGELINQDPSVRDYQKYLDEHILKMNYRTFTQVIVLGYANHTPFMLLSSNERRLMVDELLDTAIFAKMNRRLYGKNLELKNNLTILEHDIGNFKSSISVLMAHLKKLKEKEKSHENSIIEEIGNIEKTIQTIGLDLETLNLEIKNHKSSMADIEHYNNKFNELKNIKSKFAINLQNVVKELEFFDDNTICPTCSQDISTEHKKDIKITRTDNMSKISEGILQVESAVDKVQKTLNNYSATLKILAELSNSVSSKNSEISTYNKVIAQKQKELKDLADGDDVSKDTENKIKELTTSLIEGVSSKGKWIIERHYNEAASSLLKDEGIKSRIIREYIPIINGLINEYLETMNMNVKFTFDETFEETILSRFRDELKYQNLSQGEQARLSLAIILSWRKLAAARNSIDCNILFLDEILDSSISAADMESVVGLLEVVAKDNNLWCISHQPDQLADKIYSQITVTKEGNFSKMETT